MKTYYEKIINRRIKFIFIIISVWVLIIVFRLIDLQLINHSQFETLVLRQNQDRKKAEPGRGNIYDRCGEILACSLPAQNIYINPVDKEDTDEIQKKINILKSALNLSDSEAASITQRLNNNYSFTYVKKRVSREEAETVKALKLAGVGFESTSKRFYPLGTLAAHVLGGVNSDGQGISGVEYRYNSLLSGIEGEQIIFKDSRRREYQAQIIRAPVPGKDLYLTIDATIQHIARKELAEALEAHSADWGTVIVLSPFSGEVLAMVSLPDYDPNEYPKDPEAQVNRAIKINYEPGSTFKIVTSAAAIESGAISFSDYFDCSSGSINVSRLTIRDHIKLGRLSFPEVIIKSSNVGTVKIAQKLSPTFFFQTIKAFGFGEKTGIDLPAEEKGVVHPLEKWNKAISLPFISIGYELMATPLQVLNAMNVFATRGYLVRPRITLRTSDGPESDYNQLGTRRKILSESTAEALITRIFEKVVEEGTGKSGQLIQYLIAGKTGTAQKIDPNTGTYTTRKHIASFVGFIPASRPVISMIIVIDSPKEGFYYGGQVAAPVFRNIASKVLRYLQIPPDKPSSQNMIIVENRKGIMP